MIKLQKQIHSLERTLSLYVSKQSVKLSVLDHRLLFLANLDHLTRGTLPWPANPCFYTR